MKYFKRSEFDCPDCQANEMQDVFLNMLDSARDLAGVPFRINSGMRCQKHNLDVGGFITSSHLKGCAADIKVGGSLDRFKILTGLLEVGFNRFGIGSNYVHVDYDLGKPANVIWTY